MYGNFYFAQEGLVVLEQEREAYYYENTLAYGIIFFAIFLSLKASLHVQQTESNSNSYTFTVLIKMQ